MKLLIEEYQYPLAKVQEVLDGLFTLQDVEQKVSVGYVGYYYNPHDNVRDVVFILPKVLVDERNLVFGKYDPMDLIHLDKAEIEENERKFLYEFAVWIHRAIVVFNDSHRDNKIVLHRQIESEGSGARKKKSNTLLDVILSLILFNKENRQFFTFILKNIHSGMNKINWGKTISNTTAIVHRDSPVYVNPVNKKRMVNFDEELIIIFFSILQYITDRFGFRAAIPYGFQLVTGRRFERYLKGYGRTRLRKIKYKYFSDTALKLWDLCYAFFEKTYQIKTNVSQSEYLLVKSFHVVFEAMIDELIGDKDIPKGLKEQEDGKLVDHFYTYESLLVNGRGDKDIYYIGDSKYYKIGSSPGPESVYKQYTYARNVIQWNMNLFLPQQEGVSEEQLEAIRADLGKYGKIELRDRVTEGYKVIPNFFISAFIPKNEDGTANLTYDNITRPHDTQPPVNRQFTNRLYDRDTLVLSHYDINFLFVLALYARNNSGAKEEYKRSVREKFRKSIRKMLEGHFDFYAMQAHPGVDYEEYFKAHFQDTLGKTLRPFGNDAIISLALDRKDPENESLLDKLRGSFYVVKCPLGEEPSEFIAVEKERVGVVESVGNKGLFLFGVVIRYRGDRSGRGGYSREYVDFKEHKGKKFTLKSLPKGDISKIRYFVPVFDGGIDGYYHIESFSMWEKDVELLDKYGSLVKDSEGNPVFRKEFRLTLTLGEFVSLGEHKALNLEIKTLSGQTFSYPGLLRLLE